nr:leucine-rich repeat domain-containing protein [Secundilactobacillus pentosiphilus]
MPKSVTNIGDNAFAGNQITSVSLDDNLKTIGTNAFANNQIMGTLTIPDSVTSIGEMAFFDNKITELKLGTGLSGYSIANKAFAHNDIDQVINNSKDDSVDYLGGQQTYVNVTAPSTGNLIQNVRALIDQAVGVTLSNTLTFVDSNGRQWLYDADTDTLTDPYGDVTAEPVEFRFISTGNGSYGTTQLIIHPEVSAPITPADPGSGTSTPGEPGNDNNTGTAIPSGPSNDNNDETPSTGEANTSVPTPVPGDSAHEQPNLTTDSGSAISTPSQTTGLVVQTANAHGIAGTQTDRTDEAHATPEALQDTQTGQAASGVQQDASSGQVAEQTAETLQLMTKSAPNNSQTNSSAANLPQTNEAASAKATLIGGLLLSILSWFGLARRKHEQD